MNMLLRIFRYTLFCLSAVLPFSVTQASTLNLIHYWSSISEMGAYSLMHVNVLESGHDISGQFLTGAGGESTREKLTQMAIKGDVPDAAFVKGAGIARWARLGFLEDLSMYSGYNNDARNFYRLVEQQMSVNSKPYAVPVSLHRTNLIFSNTKLLKKHGIAEPQDWDELIRAMRQLKEKGITPLVIGKEAWQLATVYEAIVLSVGGPDLYRKAFVEHDMSAFRDPNFATAYSMLHELMAFTQVNVSNKRWYKPAEQFYNDQVGFLIGGDWFNGELSSFGYKAGKNYECFAMPGTEDAFIYSVDSVALFSTENEEKQSLQHEFASLLTSKEVQKDLNIIKGSIPPRQDVDLRGFNKCSLKSAADLKISVKERSALPSLANGMSASPFVTEAFLDVIEEVFGSNVNMSGVEFQKHLLKSLKRAQYTIL